MKNAVQGALTWLKERVIISSFFFPNVPIIYQLQDKIRNSYPVVLSQASQKSVLKSHYFGMFSNFGSSGAESYRMNWTDSVHKFFWGGFQIVTYLN